MHNIVQEAFTFNGFSCLYRRDTEKGRKENFEGGYVIDGKQDRGKFKGLTYLKQIEFSLRAAEMRKRERNT